jgi:hypothetical protein
MTKIKALSFEEVNELANRMGIKNFNGVFSKDELIKPKLGSYVINIMDSIDKFGNDLPGSHYVAVYIDKNKTYYFDSFSMVPPLEIINFMELRNKPIYRNNVELQAINSIMCGYFSLYIIYGLYKGRDYNEILNDFTPSVRKNDHIIKKFFNLI